MAAIDTGLASAPMAKLVAIDAGTTGVRALVVDEHARVVDVAYRELTQHFPKPGWVEHDPDEIWTAVRAALAEVASRLAAAQPVPEPVAAIGITNERETLVAFDRRTGGPLHRAIVWQDRRTAPLSAQLVAGGHLPFVRATTGLVLDPYFSATKAAWLLEHGDLGLAPDDPNLSFCTVDTWVLWQLTGGPGGGTYATDPSNASRTLLLDTQSLAWSPELCDLFGVPAHTLPEVRPSAGRFGTAALDDIGPDARILDGVPVSAILGDQQAALFGQACFEPGMVKVTYGTGSFSLANAGPPVRPRPRASSSASRGTSVRTPMRPTDPSPTRSKAPRSSPAPPSSGCATVSASSRTPPGPVLSPRRCLTAAG